MYTDNTLTELVQDLKPKDKVVYLKNLTNWNVNTYSRTYQRGFIFWNYKDSTGYEYPELTYSKNASGNHYEDSGVNKSNNTITLTNENGWTGNMVPKGTKVSQSYSGGTFNYSILVGRRITTDWVTYEATINGINNTLANIDIPQ